MKKISEDMLLCGAALLLLAVFGGYGVYVYDRDIETLSTTLRETEDELSRTEEGLNQAIAINQELANDLAREQERNNTAQEILDNITGTVEDIEKLRKLDPELLQKYSRVYFLNEHYEPPQLADIPLEHLYDESDPEEIHTQVLPFLLDMIEESADDGITLWVVSAYRSFDEQTSLKNGYTVTYGSGANQFSADQGYSEHQLGTTVDFTTVNLGGGLRGFGNTAAYEWLLDNAHRFGFTLSYPEGNAFYIFEPWHWRFVGVDLARDLHDDGVSIYDWPQRNIDEYLIKIFD